MLIREQVRTLLAAAAPPGWNVQKGNGRALPEPSVCPCIVVAIPNESVSRGAQRKRREPRLTVSAFIAETVGGDDQCDDASIWIEAALDADPTLGGVCQDCTHVESSVTPYPGGERPIWELSLTYHLRVS
ncbi:hypothetical protein [Nitratireductor pacificus]|uniref:Minor tail protein n=1 Tax=Nitratireductor pacificus pht-3B TaxID=391937 RepID=K2MIT2_9HYPH|nr:hypothetical protein [Nitratireductor pacificus]EKF17067.1 hypothetical protein NA2_19893 [Nitratireductor pacificus pht-3B]